VSADSLGNVFVADTGNHTIRKITATGVVRTFAGSAGNRGSADGPGQRRAIRLCRGVAVDAEGNLFVADSGNQIIRKITPDSVVVTVAGLAGTSGGADGRCHRNCTGHGERSGVNRRQPFQQFFGAGFLQRRPEHRRRVRGRRSGTPLTPTVEGGFGGMMQTTSAESYVGKRVRLSGWMKT
jgi:hypothetical protein